ncbi:MAG: nucleoside phosphorylase [bacterium]|nr:nucleoside phosphorylase [bacterium]
MTERKMPHTQLPEQLTAQAAILPGDPGRVDRIARHLSDVSFLAENREYRSVIGDYKGIRVIVCSTGIGGPSTAIAIEELALLGVKHMVRIGSCGCLKSGMKVGDLVLVNGAVRDDGTSKSYVDCQFPAVPDYHLLRACEEAAEHSGYSYHVGLCRSHDHIYSEKKKEFDAYWANYGVIASDMETAALFVAGASKGLHVASILNVVAPFAGDLKDGVADYASGEASAMIGEEHEILTALDAVRSVLK